MIRPGDSFPMWNRGAVGVALLAAAAVACLFMAPPAWAQADDANNVDIETLRAGAWDQSVAMELRGDAAEARDLLMQAWGPDSESYEVTVRLAWLSLVLGEAERAQTIYERARTLEGAGPEATKGLASALALAGFYALEVQNRPRAREQFERALAVDAEQHDARHGLGVLGPEFRLAPEIWITTLGQSIGEDKWDAWAAFAQADARLGDRWSLRLAMRTIQLNSETATTGFGPGRASSASSTRTLRQEEAYAGLGLSLPYSFVETYGFGILPTQGRVVAGGGARLRVGTFWGLVAEQVSIAQAQGWNHQLAPSLYVWPTDFLGVTGGARFTSDTVGTATSATVGLSLVGGVVDLHLAGHYGTERWAFGAAGFTLLVSNYEMPLGGTGTLVLHLGDELSLALQSQAERIENNNDEGLYWNGSIGLQYVPGN